MHFLLFMQIKKPAAIKKVSCFNGKVAPMKKNSLIHQFGHSHDITPHMNHFHMLYEIIYVVNGIVRINVASKSYIVKGESLIFLSNLEEHSTEILSSSYERYFLTLSPVRMDQLIQDPLLISLFKLRPESFQHVFHAPGHTETVMRRIEHEYSLGDSYSEELIASYVKEILIHLYRDDKERFPITSKNIKPEIYEIQNYMDRHFRSDVRIADLADKYFISPYYLSHCFKALTGYSPKHYLLLTRLSYAKMLLCETFSSVAEISVQSGFADANSFIRSFKKEYGITPNQYRRSISDDTSQV